MSVPGFYDDVTELDPKERRSLAKVPLGEAEIIEETGVPALYGKSELARRGKNKEGRHHLRQVGLGLLVARNSRLPLYYCVHPGNLHDSRLFEKVMGEMFAVTCGLNNTKERLALVIDKGMNSENNYTCIDQHSRIHFITSYSPYFSQNLASH